MMNEEPTQGEDAPLGKGDSRGQHEWAEDGPQESQSPSSETTEDTGREQETPAPVVGDTAVWPFQEERLQAILNLCEQFQAQLHNVEKTIREVKRGQELLAAKLRELSDKLGDVTTSFSEPRIRDLLTSLLLLHDLLDQMAGSAADEGTSVDHGRNYGVMLSQIRQILALHGIETIPTDISFDENLHRAARCIETDDLAQDGQIVQVFRKGFRSQRRVLRYADVEVLVAPTTRDSEKAADNATDNADTFTSQS